ncbi:hypothetical protein AMTRI_Chr02g255040 [Amborella trichopoda]
MTLYPNFSSPSLSLTSPSLSVSKLLLSIKVQDIKSVGLCLSISKRFFSLIRMVEDILIKVDFNLRLSLSSPQTGVSEVTHHSPVEVLKSFSSIRTLKIQLPNGELRFGDGVLLKWRAEFGTSLESCVILGLPFGELRKLRVVWTISSLIAASARHFVMRQIISEHPGLERLTITYCDNQGVLSINSGQLSEIRVKPISASASANRTQVPALSMKLRYAPYIELPNGMGFKGATLEADQFVSMAFDGAFREVAKLLVKRKTHILEMNSF